MVFIMVFPFCIGTLLHLNIVILWSEICPGELRFQVFSVQSLMLTSHLRGTRYSSQKNIEVVINPIIGRNEIIIISIINWLFILWTLKALQFCWNDCTIAHIAVQAQLECKLKKLVLWCWRNDSHERNVEKDAHFWLFFLLLYTPFISH